MYSGTLTCFHHTDRETGRRCTRCGRPACPDCLRTAAVGSHCWECIRAAAPERRPGDSMRQAALDPILVAKALIGANVVAFVLLLASGTSATGSGRVGGAADWALRAPEVDSGEWWRLVTSGFVHYGLIHLAFNMFILWQVAMVLERSIGHVRFAAVYTVAILGGSFGALLLDPLALTGGASGGVFGVAGAATLLLWRRGVMFWNTGFGPLLAINLLFTFTIPGISIGGHVGGLVAGVAAGAAFTELETDRRRTAAAFALVVVLGAAAVAGSMWAASDWTRHL